MSDNSNEGVGSVEQAPEKRTISTARLERIREANNMSVEEFIQSLLAYEVETPSESFQDCITKFGEKMSSLTKTPKVVTQKEPDWNKLTIQHLIDFNMYPISGVLNRVQSSRKYEGDHVYSVNIEQGPGTKAQTICDLTDLTSVRIEINGVMLKVINVLEDTSIPNREYKQGYFPEVADEASKTMIVEDVNPAPHQMEDETLIDDEVEVEDRY